MSNNNSEFSVFSLTKYLASTHYFFLEFSIIEQLGARGGMRRPQPVQHFKSFFYYYFDEKIHFEFNDRKTRTFQFKRNGFFYFIYRDLGHCESGQRTIVHVIMVHPQVLAWVQGSCWSGLGSDRGRANSMDHRDLMPHLRQPPKSSMIMAAHWVVLVILLFL